MYRIVIFSAVSSLRCTNREATSSFSGGLNFIWYIFPVAGSVLRPDTVLLLDVPEDILVERVTGRRTDPATGKIYHLKFNPPENDEVASRLVQRSDDTAEKITVRYKEFQSHIEAIKSCYEDKIVLVDGTVTQLEVSKCIASALDVSASLKTQRNDSTRAGTLHYSTT